MKWVTYRSTAGERAGLVAGEEILGHEPGSTLVDLLRADGGLDAAAEAISASPAERVSLAGADLAAPFAPHQIRDSLCFLDHLRNCRGGAELEPIWSELPAMYFSNVSAVVGPY
ncbi:MAG: hypothetical protein R2710_06545, partial [Acidimicrobiales bacterium]